MTTTRTFDRIAQFDERSRDFPIRTVIESEVFRDRLWECNTWNDQGREGACVGFAWSHELSATPAVVPTDYSVAFALYKRAQQIDQWPGENYSGTSVLAGAKAVSELANNQGEKYISQYRWAFGLADLLLALAHTGPAVLGVNWYQGMFNTDRNGFIRVTGDKMGGHALLAIGVNIVATVADPTKLEEVDLDASYIVLHNSWGRGWGANGTCKITLRDMQRLLAEDGDACIPLVRTVDNVVVPVDDDAVKPEPVPTEPTEPSAPEEPHAPPAPMPTKKYFSVRRSSVFHDFHPGLRVFRWYDSIEEARLAGLRPCNVCKP